MTLTNDQKNVFDKVMERLGKRHYQISPDFDYITIGGLAGTGKTFLISVIRQELASYFDTRVAFVAYTGKASSVLKSKLIDNNSFFRTDFVGTIHSLIYRPEMKYDTKTKRMVITRWIKKDVLPYDLIFVDEASMVNKQIWLDLLDYNIPIIAVGDYGQLPPIGDPFNLMDKPNYLLTEIKRQALDNPIIRLTIDIRNGKSIPYGFYDQDHKGVFTLPWSSENCKNVWDSLDFSSEDIIVLCGKNNSRVRINEMIRKKLGYTIQEPYPGEKIIFLKNNYTSKVLNGMLGRNLFLLYETKDIYDMTIELDDYEEVYSGLVYNGCFGKEQYGEELEKLQNLSNKKKIMKERKVDTIDICDFGYCISVHKSQGSEFKKVVCFVEKSYYWDKQFMQRWLYTAATRAKEKLFLITEFS